MVVLKYTGKGIISRGIHFSPTYNAGLYDVPKEDADYLLATFPKHFVLIEKKASTKTEEVEKTTTKEPEAKPARKRRTRKKAETEAKE